MWNFEIKLTDQSVVKRTEPKEPGIYVHHGGITQITFSSAEIVWLKTELIISIVAKKKEDLTEPIE